MCVALQPGPDPAPFAFDALHAIGFLGFICGTLLFAAVLVSQELATVAFKAAFLLAVLLGVARR